jgi:hypothetical protein
MIIDIETTMHRLADKNLICRSSVQWITEHYGREAKVGKRILEKAINDRGTAHFRNFFAEALGWPEPLVDYLRKLEDHTLWGGRSSYMTFSQRDDLNRRAHVAAVLAYVAEMQRP